MSWRDRDYNREGGSVAAFFSNPGGVLSFSVPILRTQTLVIRLSFWFLLYAVFQMIRTFSRGLYALFFLDIILLLGVLFWHEFGHRVVSRMFGGDHREWVLWPLGGMVPPYVSPRPKSMFWGNLAGNLFTLPIGLLALATIWVLSRGNFWFGWSGDPLMPIAVAYGNTPASVSPFVMHCMERIFVYSLAIIVANMLPIYWFDGGYIWQAALTPFSGPFKAIKITCFAGMTIAALGFLWALAFSGMPNLWNMIFWVLVFVSCLQYYRITKAAGPYAIDEEYSGVTYDYMGNADQPHKKHKRGGWWARNLKKKSQQEQALQAKIDLILEKVKNHGLHSLTWREKRTLRKATERQRQQDLVNK